MVGLSRLCSFNAQKLPKIKKVALFQKLLPEFLVLLKVLLFVLHSGQSQHRSINVARTLSEKTNYHDNTIFRNNKLADNMWKIREGNNKNTEGTKFFFEVRLPYEHRRKTIPLMNKTVIIFRHRTCKVSSLKPWNHMRRFWSFLVFKHSKFLL